MWSVHKDNSATPLSCPALKRQLRTIELLAAEQSLSYEERVRKALNFKPYVAYLQDLFTEEISDSSDSEDDDLAQITQRVPILPNIKEEKEDKVSSLRCIPKISEVQTLNLSLGDSLPLSPQFLEPFPTTVKTEPSSCGHENHKHAVNDIAPMADLELNRFLEKPNSVLNPSAADDFIISILENSDSRIVTGSKKRKWDTPKPLSHSESKLHCNILSVTASTPSAEMDFMKNARDSPDGVIVRDTSIGNDGNEIKATSSSLKRHAGGNLSGRSLAATGCYNFHECLGEKVNLNQTAPRDTDDGCATSGIGTMKDLTRDDSSDSLTDYMNITANSALVLDTYFKFEPYELASSNVPSPISPTDTSVLSSLSVPTMSMSSGDEEPILEKRASSSFGHYGARRSSLHKQAKRLQLLNFKRRRIYVQICRKEISKAFQSRNQVFKDSLKHTRQLASMCSQYLVKEENKLPLKLEGEIKLLKTLPDDEQEIKLLLLEMTVASHFIAESQPIKEPKKEDVDKVLRSMEGSSIFSGIHSLTAKRTFIINNIRRRIALGLVRIPLNPLGTIR